MLVCHKSPEAAQKDRDSARQFALANPDRVRETKRRYAARHRDKVLASKRAYNRKADADGRRRDAHLKKFGISQIDYLMMLAEQQGACKLCGVTENPPFDYFAVDHDHATGKVRGLLCHGCNRALGFFEHDLTWLRKSLEYLGVSL